MRRVRKISELLGSAPSPAAGPPPGSCDAALYSAPWRRRALDFGREGFHDLNMAEEVGFEPTDPFCGSPVFKTGAIGHSATLPMPFVRSVVSSILRTSLVRMGRFELPRAKLTTTSTLRVYHFATSAYPPDSRVIWCLLRGSNPYLRLERAPS